MREERDLKKSTPDRYAHGGGVDAAAAQTGLPVDRILDFSASINPLGPPDSVLEAARASLSRIDRYPEIDAASFECALSDYHGLAPEQVLAGNGSTDLIYLLPRALQPRRALLVAPCFSEYERALRQAGVPFEFHILQADCRFALRPDELAGDLDADTDLVWLANPGNPNGSVLPARQVQELLDALPGRPTVVVDEAFIDFALEHSCLSLLKEYSNLLILRSMTKFYAIPGLRLGYLLGAPEKVARLARLRLPWSLSAPALAAGRACLDASAYRQRSLQKVPRLRNDLRDGLEQLGLHVFEAAANYLLARLPGGASAASLAAQLHRQGILIRDCGNFEGLDGSFVRVAVRGDAENGRLLQALGELLDL